MKYIILGHENPDIDSLVSGYLLEKIMKAKGYDAQFVIPDETVSRDNIVLLNKYGLDISKYFNKELMNDVSYVLVDHHERVVPGTIVAIIDHHPTNMVFSNISYYKNENVCSTACLIAFDNLEYLNEFDMKLVCLSSFVDTASFNSTKTNENDVIWVKEMCRKYNFDYTSMYEDGLCLTDLSCIDEACFNGLKKYKINGSDIYSSYIQIESFDKNIIDVYEILDKLYEYRKQQKVDLFVFIVYDMTYFYTKVYLIDDLGILCHEYKKYASRGNTIIPVVVEKYC